MTSLVWSLYRGDCTEKIVKAKMQGLQQQQHKKLERYGCGGAPLESDHFKCDIGY
ncbi:MULTISPECIES: hypothetical protein [Xanthomonas]|uniref:hypothetical protein n=1 Tax=Xanthomonas TaxID=338 RepID=UPI001ADC1D22|nr:MULTISPECIES: hypothetical protein [unclassified Xanthomonas]MBO9873122.1 hypothetical protein [Xanthomonas sp. D-93]WNH44673.1 hypothetical protein PG878_19535 [Xanthomonas sp. A6251]